MKTVNLDPEHQLDVTRGRKSTLRSGSSGITVRDSTTTGYRIFDVTVIGGTWAVNEDGTAVLTIDTEDFLDAGGGDAGVVYTNATSGTALTLDLALYSVFDITLTANCTITFSNPPTDGRAHIWIFTIRQDAVGGWTVTWPAAVEWQDTDGTSGGAAPTLYTVPGAEDVFQIATLDDGVTYGGGQERPGGGGGALVLDDLTDVTITAPTAADRLRYDGAGWVNSSLHWEPMVDYDGLVMLDSGGGIHVHEVSH